MKHLLKSAQIEINQLRKSNELLGAQMQVVEIFAAALGMRRGGSGAMAPDITWELQQAINKLEEAEKTA